MALIIALAVVKIIVVLFFIRMHMLKKEIARLRSGEAEYEFKSSSPIPQASGSGRRWVNCPVCGEADMRCETDAEGANVITCTNTNCGSNGGDNFAAIKILAA